MTTSPSDYPYGRDLPWGWWLRDVGGRLHDAEGRVWTEVREAFWVGRLGLNSIHVARGPQEQMLRVLNGIDARWIGGCETRAAIFGGDMFMSQFYMAWLGSVGMLHRRDPGDGFDAQLSDEGRAAMLMLRATREPAWVDLPFPDVIDAVARERRGQADLSREEVLRAFEQGISPARHVFAREGVGRAWTVTLTSIDPSARLPVRKVVWSCSFKDDRTRDDLFGWMALRVHSWQDWGELVWSKGASALTSHLLSLIVGSWGEEADPRAREPTR